MQKSTDHKGQMNSVKSLIIGTPLKEQRLASCSQYNLVE